MYKQYSVHFIINNIIITNNFFYKRYQFPHLVLFFINVFFAIVNSHVLHGK